MENWTYVEIDNFYERVRSELNNISLSVLTDDMIDMPEKAPYATEKAKIAIPKWSEYLESKDSKFALFEGYIVIQTAIYFARFASKRQPTRMQTSSVNVEYANSAEDELIAMLKYKLEDLLEMLDESDTSIGFFGFRVT